MRKEGQAENSVPLADGSLLWHRKKTTNNPNMLYANGNLLVGIDPHTKKIIDIPAENE